MALYPEAYREWWRFLTYGFMHAPPDSGAGISHIAVNMFTLFIFGPKLCRQYGSIRFLCIYLLCTAVGGFFWVLTQPMGVGNYLMGASAGVIGIITLYAFHFPKSTFLPLPTPIGVYMFPCRGAMSAWSLTVAIIAYNLCGLGNTTSIVAYWGHLGGIVVAIIVGQNHLLKMYQQKLDFQKS